MVGLRWININIRRVGICNRNVIDSAGFKKGAMAASQIEWLGGYVSDDILCAAKFAIGNRIQTNPDLVESIVSLHLEVKLGEKQ
jgi:hypothetical protein